MIDAMNEDMKERIRNVLTTLTKYRATRLGDARLEVIITQIESVQDAIDAGRSLSRGEKDALDFNLTEGTALESNEQLQRELQSIKNFAMNVL